MLSNGRLRAARAASGTALVYPPPVAEPNRYRAAGAIYFALGALIMAITVLAPGLASPERRADLVHLLVGLPFFALFALLIAYGDRAVARLLRLFRVGVDKAERIGLHVREKLVMLLAFSGVGRTFVFAANGLGWKPGVSWRPFTFSLEPVAPTPRMWINAVLMAIIVAVLVRAAWVPFLRRRRANGTAAG